MMLLLHHETRGTLIFSSLFEKLHQDMEYIGSFFFSTQLVFNLTIWLPLVSVPCTFLLIYYIYLSLPVTKKKNNPFGFDYRNPYFRIILMKHKTKWSMLSVDWTRSVLLHTWGPPVWKPNFLDSFISLILSENLRFLPAS